MALAQQPRQSLSQRISPGMRMSLSLLQLPITDLRETVKKEIDANPALEVVQPYRGERAVGPSRGASSGDGDKEGFLENVADERGETLDEHLMSELRMAGADARTLALAEALVAQIDGDGRFKGTYADLQMTTGASPDELESVRRRILTIDPKGCAARDLAECYRAQLGSIPAAQQDGVNAAIDLLAATLEGRPGGGNAALARIPRPILTLLKKLDPFPGRQYDHRKTEFVTPDVLVDEKGEVTVDTRDVPEVRVSAKYAAMARDKDLDAETRAFAAERIQRARTFQEALLRRQDTLERIALHVMAAQQDYLKNGAAALRKLTMSEVAKAVKCDVSTVSRAAMRKYVKTPRGTIPLRTFFVLVDQEPIEKLRELLAAVPAGEEVSDLTLSKRMKAAGYTMARRTVAKYRARLGFTKPEKRHASFHTKS